MSGTLSTLAGEYLQGSFRGIPFVVVGSGGSNGRNFQVHRYPFRDRVWAEDLGRAPRSYRIRAFLIGPECLAQRDLLVKAAETNGPGLLVHPTIGVIQAALLRFEWYERDGVMGVVDVEMELVEASSYLSSTIMLALHAAVGVAAVAFGSAISSDYAATTLTPYSYGATVLHAGRGVASDWGSGANRAIRSPRAFAGAMAALPGNNGRYASGSGAVVNGSATVGTILAGLTASSQVVSANVSALDEATDADTLATGIMAVPESVRSAIADPAAQIAVLMPLATYSPAVVASGAPIGGAIATAQTATATLCRQATLLSLAYALADWQPATSDDAQAMRARIGAMLDDESVIAADAGDGATFQALRDLRAQVLQDLADRAARLPDLVTVTRNAPVPALVLAQQVYANGSRAPDLIQRANPIHPAFMPTSFEALSS
ncbi:DNA circularization protein [Komagataeibacter melomenusus]